MQLPQVTVPLLKARRDRRGTPRRSPSRPAREVPERSRDLAERRDATRGGGPQDRATYACGCGYVFTAPVTTSVACPHCGTDQAW